MSDVILSDEQLFVFDKFKRGENIFLTGQAGTGKTMLIQQMAEYLNNKFVPFKVCALTGCAAILLGCKAVTLHSFAGIGICAGDSTDIINAVMHKKRKMVDWRTICVLIIDEVSMMSKKIFDIIECIARKSRLSSAPFGGIQIIMTGDFMQLPPVPTMGDVDSGMFCFESLRWNTVFSRDNHIELKTVFRQRDPIYREILAEARNGQLSAKSVTILESRLGLKFDPEEHNGCVPTKIFATRTNVDYVNRIQYTRLKTEEYVYNYSNCSTNIIYIETGQPIPSIKLSECSKLSHEDVAYESRKLLDSSNFQQILRLKIGTVVMCIVNIDMDNGICNGSQGIVIAFREKSQTDTTLYPVVKFHNGLYKLMLPYSRQNEDYPSISIGQVPLVPAWAISIHKCQGATMDIAEIDIGTSIFEYGQSYVALSRVKDLEGLYLSGFDPSRIKTHNKVITFYSEFRCIREMMRETNIQQLQDQVVKINPKNNSENTSRFFGKSSAITKMNAVDSEIELEPEIEVESNFDKFKFIPIDDAHKSTPSPTMKIIKFRVNKSLP